MRANRKRYIMVTAAISIIIVILSVLYSKYITDLLTRESQMHLSEVATQGAASVKRQISRDFDILNVLADGIISSPEIPLDQKMIRMKKQADKFNLFRIAIVDLQGNAKTSDGYEFSVSDREFFKRAVKGEQALSDPIVDKVDKVTSGIVYAVPVYNEDKITNVLFSGYKLDTLVDRIDISFYHKKGMAFIADSSGDVLLHPIKERQGQNLLEVAKTGNQKKIIKHMEQDLQNGKNGVVKFSMSGKERFFAYAPIEGANDWFLITSLPASVVFERSEKVIFLTMLLLVVISFILIVVAWYIVVTKKKSDEKIIKMAYYDSLTGAANLERFKLDSANLFAELGPQKYTLLNFDIKQFRYLNKELGYEAGNQLLIHITNCLKNIVQKKETFARVGADQFLLLFLNKASDEEMKSYINDLRDNIVEWNRISKGYYLAKLTFGVYYVGEQDSDVMIPIEKSNIARKSIKNSYELNIAVYTKKIQDRIEYEKELENSVSQALENDEFKLYIQPKYNLLTEEIVGGEALVRWIKPDGTRIMPDDFISLFEKTGAIYSMDMYMLKQVCRFIRSQLNRNIASVPISINQSRCYMYDQTYVDTICRQLKDEEVSTNMIELEITENIVYGDLDKLIKVLEALHQKGFFVSLDDFGSGYSSLNVLKELRVDAIKLDRFMLSETLDSKREETVVTNIIKMARELEMSVVAEGVETLEQANFLREAGCEIAQGYYYSKPVPAEEFEYMLLHKQG
ncbi:MAG: GGDEF domain-containing protein [Lachnospiraceae bacterium]